MQSTEQEPRSRKDKAHRAGSEAATAASIGGGLFAVFFVALNLSLAVLAASTARGAGPVVGWGLGAPPPKSPITATAIAAGSNHSCAIQAGTGAVVCWRYNDFGQGATPPASVDGTAGTASAIAAGGAHSCAIQAGSGRVVCWGDNGGGQATPPPSVDGTAGTASAIAAGYSHSCAIQAGSGRVVCWGNNSSGQ